MEIAGKLVLITGASSGIGAATAKAMAREGGRVVLLARRRAALEEVAAEVKKGGHEAWVYAVDLSDPSAVEQTAQAILSEVGVPDIVINNAGAGRWLPVDETTADECMQMMASPFFGAFYVTRAFLPDMRKRNTGQLLHVTSPAGFVAWPNSTTYTVARWAMRGFHEALRADLKDTQIRSTLIVPTAVASTYFANNPGGEERLPGIAKLYGKLTPEQVADAMVKAVQREKRQVVLPATLDWTLRLHRIFPRMVEWMLLKTAAKGPPPGKPAQ